MARIMLRQGARVVHDTGQRRCDGRRGTHGALGLENPTTAVLMHANGRLLLRRRAASTGMPHMRRGGSLVRWIVLRSHPQRENFAAECVSQQGYAVFLPRVLEYSGRGAHRFALAKPLFPSYLFVGIESRWRPLLSTFGVAAVIMAGEAPRILPPPVIEQLPARLDVDGFVRLPQPPRRAPAPVL